MVIEFKHLQYENQTEEKLKHFYGEIDPKSLTASFEKANVSKFRAVELTDEPARIAQCNTKECNRVATGE